MDGDEVILVGYSRGAFTVRSVAGMVGHLGLLTREGVEHFYPIFKDMQNWENPNYEDPFPNVPFPNKPKGPNAATEYRARLAELNYTRVVQSSGRLISIKAVCVWDTVGSLGIPRIAWLERLGIRAENDEYKWHDTSLSDRIEHAFQALALDETRAPFSPAVWERLPHNKLTTDLRQVWFPGNHGNCGGGWPDQGMSNLTLAWMMDQLASIGVEFDTGSLERIFTQTTNYYHESSREDASFHVEKKKWAVDQIYENNEPVRPWGLGAIQETPSLLYQFAGKSHRTPGLYRQADPHTGLETGNFLMDTNERIHSSVRIRLACRGLGLNDKAVWKCEALSKWKPRRTNAHYDDPVPPHPGWAPDAGAKNPSSGDGSGRWIWEYIGNSGAAPKDAKMRILVEEPLGPYERYCLKMAGGEPNVYDFAENSHLP
jgi:hypothetical protein